MDNGGYLFAAFSVIWVLLFGYVFVLMSRQKRIRREIDSLKETLRHRAGTRGPSET